MSVTDDDMNSSFDAGHNPFDFDINIQYQNCSSENIMDDVEQVIYRLGFVFIEVL